MRRVLIADDHAVTRRGLVEILEDAFPEVEVVEAIDGPTLFAQLDRRGWDLILLDAIMPKTTVVRSLTEIRAQNPAVPVLVITAATEMEYVVESLKAGANGVVHKHRTSDELVEAIERVSHGGTYLHPDTASSIALSMGPNPERKRLPHQDLSARELEIFRLIALGRTVKEIAADLGLSDKTVATYISRIRDKTALMNAVDIARYALKHGLVDGA